MYNKPLVQQCYYWKIFSMSWTRNSWELKVSKEHHGRSSKKRTAIKEGDEKQSKNWTSKAKPQDEQIRTALFPNMLPYRHIKLKIRSIFLKYFFLLFSFILASFLYLFVTDFKWCFITQLYVLLVSVNF